MFSPARSVRPLSNLLSRRPRLSAVGEQLLPIRFHLLRLCRALLAKKGPRVGAGGEGSDDKYFPPHRETAVEKEERRRARLHLRSLPNGVESFHAEGSSSSFTDREPSTRPLRSFLASREIFSLRSSPFFLPRDGEISLRDFPNNNSHATIEGGGGIFSTVSTIRIESFLPLLRSIPCTNETFVRIIAWNSPLRSDKEVEGKREEEG